MILLGDVAVDGNKWCGVEAVNADGRESVGSGRCGHYLKPPFLGLMPPSPMTKPLLLQVQ